MIATLIQLPVALHKQKLGKARHEASSSMTLTSLSENVPVKELVQKTNANANKRKYYATYTAINHRHAITNSFSSIHIFLCSFYTVLFVSKWFVNSSNKYS